MGSWVRNMASYLRPWRRHTERENVLPMVAEDVHLPQPSGSDMSLTNIRPASNVREPFVIPPYQRYRQSGTHNGHPIYQTGPNGNVGIPRTSTPVQGNGAFDNVMPERVARP